VNYSRYIFFYLNYLIENDEYAEAKNITDDLDYLSTSLLVSQGKKWIESKKIKEFKKIFSCRNSTDIASEFFFLVSNLYSSKDDLEKSNFYLNISHYLNPKFKFNLSLLAENYYLNLNYIKTLKILESFDKNNEFYYWFRLKKEAQIISKKQNKDKSLDFINFHFKKIKNPSTKIIFDIANFNKNAKKYKDAIKYYDQIISKIDINSQVYAEILYRRGGSYERLGDYINSDKDLLKSLEVNPDDAYVINYLAYSWLEREHKIDLSLQMLEKAYSIKSNDPYIIDSIGWAYYLVNDHTKAENFLRRAVELMPEDPVVNDHYGDILWKLDRQIQARYFWKNVLNLEETEDEMKKSVKEKLMKGLINS
jgi:tetratricopeptide (TPR) repeat protein